MINDEYYRRRYVLTAIILVVVLVYIGRLFSMQIIDDSTRQKADNNAVLKQIIYAPRGLIYDRNGELLVYNQPIYEVTLVMRQLRNGFDTLSFCHSLNITKEEFISRVGDIKDRQKNRGYSPYTPQVFLSQLSKEDVAVLQESLYKFNGVNIRKRTLRDYTYPAAAQVLGSVGEVSQDDIDRDPYYSAGDYSGRDGIERTYETVLRGEKGVEKLMRNSKGIIQGSYKNGEEDEPAFAGEDITLTLDIQLQMIAEELLQGKIGSVVAIEPKTGEILALVSSPTWDPSLLVGRERSANYNKLLNDHTKPLLNRATQAQYPPGSTFKTLQAAVGLQEGVLTKNTLYGCSGPGTKPIKCTHHHGSPNDLEKALEQSCNPYFWCAFRDFLEKDGYGKNNERFTNRYELWRQDVLSFGLGQRFTDTDVGSNASGNIPTVAYYDKYFGKAHWNSMTIRSLSIGQGEVLVTPLQLCNMAAAIANDGWYITPHLLKNDTMLTHIHHTNVDSKHFAVVKEGMRRVMVYGTGRHYKLDSISSGGKTGTAQAGKGRVDHAFFIGIAPIEDPQIAIMVVVENSGFGATWAAPIASLLMEQYLTGEIKRTDLRYRMANHVINHNVQTYKKDH